VASVAVDDVRDVINVSSAEAPDAKVLKMIKRAEVSLELETIRSIDYSTIGVLNKLQEGISMLSFLFRTLNHFHVWNVSKVLIPCD